MSALTVLGTLVLPLAQKAPNPADVKPGWLAFGIFLLMALATTLLWLSFRRQLKKVDFIEAPDPRRPRQPVPGGGDSESQPRG